MNFTISEVFCEVISGLAFFLTVAPLLYLANIADPIHPLLWAQQIDGGQALLLITGGYVFGVVLNVIGLPADDLLTKIGISGHTPPRASRKNFYKNATSHLLAYRTNAWNHYYCFRNLLIFSPFAVGLWSIHILIERGLPLALGVLIFGVISIVLLYKGVRSHADVYTDVTATYDD